MSVQALPIVCQYCGDEMVAGHITINAAPAHLECALAGGDVTEEAITLEDPSVELVALEDLKTDDSGDITPLVEPHDGVNCLAKRACGFPSCDCTEIADKKRSLVSDEEDEATIEETIVALEDAGHDVSLIRGTQDVDPGGRAFPVMEIEDVTDFDATGKFHLGVMPEEPTAEEVTALDFGHIAAGVKSANERGLLVEFIWSFHQAAKNGSTIAEAVAYALAEWDM